MNDQTHRLVLGEDDFVALLVKYEPALRAYARSLVPDWALVDDALQEASVTMWQKRGQLETADGFVPWAPVILRFKCLRQLEKLRACRALLSSEVLETLAQRAEGRSLEVAMLREQAVQTCLRAYLQNRY